MLIGACLLALALTATLGAQVTSGAHAQPGPVHSRDHGDWKYIAGRDQHGRLMATVKYDDRSVGGLRAYAAANQGLLRQLARDGGQADIQVTFRGPVELNAFRAWVATRGLSVEEVTLRMVDARGTRWTIGAFPSDKDPLPQAAIDRQIAKSSEVAGPLTMRGVITVRGRVDAARLLDIAADAQVFLADVTPTVVPRDLQAAGVEDAAQALVNVPPAFWQMESLGLQHFR
jgi:hypothetical protein